MLAKHLLASFMGDARASGLWAASRRLGRSLRALWFPRRTRRTLAVLAHRAADLKLHPHEYFYFLQQRHHLSQRLSVRQRIECVGDHYGYEAARYLPSFRDQVYRRAGLLLWRAVVDATEFSIKLLPGNDSRCEGDLSVVLFVGDGRLSVMSFSYVNASLFGLPRGPVLFITRNQSGRGVLQQGLFRAAFKQTTPQQFCLAAVTGIADANGMPHVAAVGHEAHIARDPANNAHLKNSYTEFWRGFGARPLDRQSYLLPVPMETTPLAELKSKYRRRAVERRRAWAQVADSARSAIAEHQGRMRLAHCLGNAWFVLAPLLAT